MAAVTSSQSHRNLILNVNCLNKKSDGLNPAPLTSIKVTGSKPLFQDHQSLKFVNCGSSVELCTVHSSLGDREAFQAFSELPPTQSQVEENKSANKNNDKDVKESTDSKNWRVKDAVKAAVVAIAETPVETLGSAAIYGALISAGYVVANNMLDSVNSLPLISETLKSIGVGYCGIVVSQYLSDNRISLEPISPIQAVIKLSDLSPMDALKESGFEISGEIDIRVQEALKQMLDQRDAALARVKELENTGDRMVKLMAEKEALEAVAMQLAQERHQARWEADALRTAVKEMTQRMKGVESCLDSEIVRLQENNMALETVAMQLVAERDEALKQADEAHSKLESVIKKLTEERDRAFERVNELQKVVANFREAYSSASGLTNEQETFIKSRIRVIRSNYVDITKSYSEQKDAVDKLVSHLVLEYGAPSEWTSNYIHQFLNASSMDGRSLHLKSPAVKAAETPKNVF